MNASYSIIIKAKMQGKAPLVVKDISKLLLHEIGYCSELYFTPKKLFFYDNYR